MNPLRALRRLTGDTDHLRELLAATDRMRQAVETLTNQLNENTRSLREAVEGRTSSLRERLDRQQEDAVGESGRVSERLDRLQQAADNQSTSVNERLDRFYQTADNFAAATNERLDRLQQAADNQSCSVNERLDRLYETIDHLAGDLNKRVDRLIDIANDRAANARGSLKSIYGSTDARDALPPRAEGAEPVASAKSDRPPGLKILCIGTGRDGTKSLYHMFHRLLAASGGGRVMHEYCCREFYQAFCDLRETGEQSHAAALERMVAECPWDCVVGNGYAAILPLFAKIWGRGLKVVHLRRADREACIASLVKNCELFPTAYCYYSSSPDATVKRMAAFHFGEMSRAEWDRLSIEQKFAWYYDKTHALVRDHLNLFDEHIEVTTESLNGEETRRAIARFISGADAAPPPKAHLNASAVDIASFAKEHQHKMHWLMGQLNIAELATDEVYGIDYFLEKFVAWMGYQIMDSAALAPTRPAPEQKIQSDLERAVRVIRARLEEVDSLYRLMRERRMIEEAADSAGS